MSLRLGIVVVVVVFHTSHPSRLFGSSLVFPACYCLALSIVLAGSPSQPYLEMLPETECETLACKTGVLLLTCTPRGPGAKSSDVTSHDIVK